MGKKIFSADNRFNRFLARLFDLIVLNLLWLLCCIPLITIGASTIALYAMTLRLARDEDVTLVADFFKAFKSNLWQSVPVTLIFHFLYGLIFYHIVRVAVGALELTVFNVASCFALPVLVTAIWVWVIPLMARYENTIPMYFNNAWRLAISHLSYTVTFVVTTSFSFVWAAFGIHSFVYSLPVWLLIGGAGVAMINSFYLRKVFDNLEKG